MDDFRDIEMIEKYLSKGLNAPTTAAFEKAMQHDENLKQHVLAHQDILKGIDMILEKDLANSVKSAAARFKERGGLDQEKLYPDHLNDDTFPENKSNKKNQLTENKTLQKDSLAIDKEQKKPTKIKFLARRRFLSIAASLLFLLATSYYLLRPTPSIGKQLYVVHTKMPNQKLIDRMDAYLTRTGFGLDKEKNELLLKNLKLYIACSDIPCDYASLNNFPEELKEDKTALFCKRLTDINAAKEEDVPILLEQLLPTDPKERDIRLYLELAYLKKGNNPSKTIRVFERIIRNASKPQSLLEELKSK